MDGKGSYNDNLFIERPGRTVKYEEVYLKAYQDGREAKAALADYSRFYNNQRPHQGLGYRTPAAAYNSSRLATDPASLIVSKGALRTAEPHLILAPVPTMMGSTSRGAAMGDGDEHPHVRRSPYQERVGNAAVPQSSHALHPRELGTRERRSLEQG
jgi:hypothetical protein